MNAPTSWHDQIAVVTGGGGSIGAAIVAHLGALGARVASADLNMAEGYHPDPSPF